MKTSRKITQVVVPIGLIIAVLLSNIGSFIRDGMRLEHLRGSVLRLHIIANSDSEEDQRLKICVRDALLKSESEIFGEAGNLEEAETAAEEKLPEIVKIAESTLRAEGCLDRVQAEIADVEFDERTYGDITMPAGTYRALRVTIGEAKGHNWWCVMYPPLCIPAACTVRDNKEKEEELFTSEELDILRKPKKYRVRFAVWDKMKSWFRW